jgi:HD-GYP domain-containing protein (c-di-GMP phosphodiesterase class II)
MDKKKQMVFNLNNFLLAFSGALNTKKATFIALNIAKELNFDEKKLADICSYNLAFPLGIKSLEKFDFLDLNHLKDDTFLQISEISQKLSKNFDFKNYSKNDIEKFKEFIENENFNIDIKTALKRVLENKIFFFDILYDEQIVLFIYSNLQDFTKVLDFEDILKMTNEFNLYIDKESKIIERAEIIAEFFEFEHKDKEIFKIASTLANIGKLYTKNLALNDEAKELSMNYAYFTKMILNQIMGFNDISSLASKVQERLDGSGVFALSSKDLSFKDRLLSSINLYGYFKEAKPYKKAYSHKDTIEALTKMAKDGKIDESLVEILDKVFEEEQ